MPLKVYQPSFTGGELAPSLYARTDLGKYGAGLRTCRNFLIHPHGGASSRPGFAFVAEVKDSAQRVRLIPFVFSVTQQYVLEFGVGYLRVHKDGGTVLNPNGSVFECPTPYLEADLERLAFAGRADTLFLVHPRHAPRKLTRQDHNAWTLSEMTFGPLSASPSMGEILEGALKGTVASVSALPISASAGQIYRVTRSGAKAGTEAYFRYTEIVPPEHATWGDEVIKPAIYDWRTTPPPVSKGGAVFTNPGGVAYTTDTVSYKVTAIHEDTGEESLPSVVVSCAGPTETTWPQKASVTVSWEKVTGAGFYKVYKADNAIFGFIGSTEATSFKDLNTAPDLALTPPGSRNPFEGAGNYPSAVAFHEQRLYLAATLNAPQTVWASVINAYANFNVSRPARDDEAMTFTLAASQINEVRHLMPLGDLILLTSDAEWRVSGGGDDTPLTPSSLRVKPQSYRGASRVPPIVIGNTILYVQDKGSIVRDLGYKLEVDGFTGDDLSVLSNHLFEGYQITAWAYAQVPHSIVWALRSDGTLLGLSYLREHQVWAWHRHDTQGVFESVCTVSEGAEDVLYVVVRRGERRFIERLHERNWKTAEDAFCVDAGLSYRGEPTRVISGLVHLEGREVAILADGDVVARQGVQNGQVTLPRPYRTVHVGLPYTCDLETLDLDLGQTGEGTVQARKKTIPRLSLRLWRSREFEAGPSADRLLKTRLRPEHYDEALALSTGDQELVLQPAWNSHGRVLIRQAEPVPLTVLAIMPEVEIGG